MQEKYLEKERIDQEKIQQLKNFIEELKVESEQYKLQTDKIRRASVSLINLPIFSGKNEEERKNAVQAYNEGILFKLSFKLKF
jgi:hypothetical protein